MQLGGSVSSRKSISWQRLDSTEGQFPEARSSCSICYHYDSRQAFLFGGKNTEGTAFDDTVYSLTINRTDDGSINAKWKILEDCSGKSPGFINGHSSVCVGDIFYIFGGKSKDGNYLNTLHQMDLHTHCWSEVKTKGQQPQPRNDHTMTSIGNRIYVFGGEGESGLLNDLYLFDVENKKWQEMPTGTLKPSRRCGAALVGMRNTNDDGDLLCLVFGSNRVTQMDDMFTYSSKTKEWYERPSRGDLHHGRSYFLSCLLMAGKILMFGGTSTLASERKVTPHNDSFIYNVLGGSWTKLHQAGDNLQLLPTPRSHIAGFKQGRNAFVVYGGLDHTGKTLGDLWCAHLAT